jgi:hypothetical protein
MKLEYKMLEGKPIPANPVSLSCATPMQILGKKSI